MSLPADGLIEQLHSSEDRLCCEKGPKTLALCPIPHRLRFWQAQEEIDRVLGEADKPDMAGYTELKYLMRCINESMRLYPHPPVLLRRAEVADTLPGDHLPLSHSHPLLLFHCH